MTVTVTVGGHVDSLDDIEELLVLGLEMVEDGGVVEGELLVVVVVVVVVAAAPTDEDVDEGLGLLLEGLVEDDDDEYEVVTGYSVV